MRLPLQKKVIFRNCRKTAKKTKEKKKPGHAVSWYGKSRIYRNTFQASRPASRRRSMRVTITAGLPLLNCNGSVYYLLQGQTRFRYSRQQLELRSLALVHGYTGLGVSVSVRLVDFLRPEQTRAFWSTQRFHRFQLRRRFFHLKQHDRLM